MHAQPIVPELKMKFTLCLTMCVLAALTARGRAGPVPQPPASLFADEKAERESADFNEVGPAEDWKLMQRMSKTNAFDPAADSEKRLVKEIEEFTRLVVQSVNGTEDAMTTEDGRPQDDDAAVTETDRDAASSEWTGATWRYPQLQLGSRDNGGAPSERQEAAAADGNFEEIVKKISNDLKKLYVKIKQVMTVVKNWINAARGRRTEFDEPYTLTSSASESDGVFVIADPLIGDVDKSNKYTVPIHAD